MNLSQHWNIKIYSLLKRGFGHAPVFLFILLTALSTEAKDLFSKQYGLPCKQCHTKISNLKEFGQNFKNNGYSLEKRAPVTKEVPAGAVPSAAEPQSSSIADAPESTNEKSIENSSLKTPANQPPDITEFPYRWRSKDGTYFFTDNPTSLHGTDNALEKRYPVTSKKNRSRGAKTSQSASARTQQKKHYKRINYIKGPAEIRKRGGLLHATVQQPASKAKIQPRNFEDCMEKVLIEFDQPKNGQEAMELFERAEHSCAPYATKR